MTFSISLHFVVVCSVVLIVVVTTSSSFRVGKIFLRASSVNSVYQIFTLTSLVFEDQSGGVAGTGSDPETRPSQCIAGRTRGDV